MSAPRHENTKTDVLGFLAEAMSRGSANGMIEEQEARGQRQLAHSDVLPTRVLHGDRYTLEAAGVVFGEPADDIFTHVTLPDGWKIEPTDHSMWSNLLDADGVERASIFYKAAFYDRSAHMDVLSR